MTKTQTTLPELPRAIGVSKASHTSGNNASTTSSKLDGNDARTQPFDSPLQRLAAERLRHFAHFG